MSSLRWEYPEFARCTLVGCRFLKRRPHGGFILSMLAHFNKSN